MRQQADDVYDLLIEPALQPFDFVVVRADKIPGPSSISDDVIRLVQESALCIADLTGSNPNVFYECGRRHETGKPMILIIRRGERIPFDLAGIRTIAYDLSDTRKARDCVLQVQDFVREIEKAGFAESRSGATLTTVIETLARIERKLNSLHIGSPSLPTPSNITTKSKSITPLLLQPTEIMNEALQLGDLPTLVDVLPRVERQVGVSLPLVTCAAVAAINGEKIGADILARVIQSTSAKATRDLKSTALVGLVQYFIGTDRASEGVDLIPQIVGPLLDESLGEQADIAQSLNQLQMLYYAAEDFSTALMYCERAVALNPEQPSYFYNLSLIYEKLGLPNKALEAIDACLALGQDDDDDHLVQAFDVYRANGLSERASSVLDRLRAKNPAMALRVEARE